MMRFLLTISVVLMCVAPAQAVDVQGGQTNVDLDFATLESVAGLTLSSLSPEVIAPGNSGFAVAFPINSRDAMAPLLPTTFSYNPADFLGSFSGSIEHVGSVFFNSDTVQVGNFSIGFDAARAMGANSGFFVASTVGIAAPVFDVQAPSTLIAGESSLTIGADLAVSPELASTLISVGLTTTDLTGAVVGSALVEAVPEPAFGTIGLSLVGLGMIARRRLSR